MNQQSAAKWVRSASLVLVVVFVPILSGCGKSKGTVSGTVTYQGKPLPGGFITIIPEQGEAGAFRGKIEPNGAYRVSDIPAGPVKIGVQALEPPKHPEAMLSPEEIAKGAKAPAISPGTYMRIPPIYNDPDKSGLGFTVNGGTQEHDIPLK
jgi:hypothetical protein